MILLDTCTLLWLNGDRDEFSKRALKKIKDYSDALAVSPISFMEIGIKSSKGKLHLPVSLEDWTDAIIERYGLTVFPLTTRIAVAASTLPPHHQDPFDRLILATALLNKLPIVTADQVFREYSSVKVVW